MAPVNDPLSLALVGPFKPSGEDGAAKESDAEVVAADVFDAIEAKSPSALVDALRNLIDVIQAERDAAEEAAESKTMPG